MTRFEHIPVMLDQCIEGLNIKPDGVYLDGTVGGAGHSTQILKRLKGGTLIAVDRDPVALRTAKERLEPIKGDNTVIYANRNYSEIGSIVTEAGIAGLDGVLIDMGVSSHQFDESERGFSYQKDGPLDMRMNQSVGMTAADVVNQYAPDELNRVFREYGEVTYANAITSAIVRRRERCEFETTLDLAECVANATPAKFRRQGHPARQIFQALRIEVNNELGVVPATIEDASKCMNVGGRICVISFHSLEDRLIKKAFEKLDNPCTCPPDFPICVCGKVKEYSKVTGKPIVADQRELDINPRSRSAKLRIIEKIK